MFITKSSTVPSFSPRGLRTSAPRSLFMRNAFGTAILPPVGESAAGAKAVQLIINPHASNPVMKHFIISLLTLTRASAQIEHGVAGLTRSGHGVVSPPTWLRQTA